MRCPQCNHETEYDFKFCPECGAASQKGTVESEAVTVSEAAQNEVDQEELQARRMAYVREDYNPQRDGKPVTAAGRPSEYTSAHTASTAGIETKPPIAGMIVFSLINMLCCGFGISMILGIIALVFTIISTSEPTWDKAAQKLSTARMLNIVGLVFIVIQLVVFFAIVIGSIIFSVDTGYSTW